MSTYKNLIGKDVNFLTTDPDNDAAEGQIWYNSTAGVFKDLLVSEAWSSGGNMINQRAYQGSAGSVSAGLVFGGSGAPSYPSPLTLTEEYNGSGFTAGGAMNVALAGLNGSGTQTAALAFGGFKPPSNTTADNTEEYDGSSWTVGGALGTARFFLGSAKSAPQTAGLAFGGNPGYKTNTEEYNGSSWTAGGALNQGRNQFDGAGTQTAGLAVGGQHSPPFRQLTDVEEYDGSSWTSVTGIPTATEDNAASGLQTAALTYGGSSPSATANSFAYNGSTWTATPSMANARQNGAGTGTGSSSALSTGGGPPSNGRTITEEYTRSANVITGAAWASGGNMNIGRGLLASAGTSESAMLGAGGYSPAAPAHNTWSNVEEYNGSSWSEVNNLPTIKSRFRGAGTQTAAVTFGGFTPLGPNTNYNTTEKYDGTNWTTSGNMNTARCYMAGFGIQTAAVSAGGATLNPDVGFNKTEEYNGTSWSEVNNMPNYFRNQAGVGIITAGVVTSGKEGPSASYPGLVNTTTTLEYDGTNWTAGGTGLITGGNASGGGTQSVAWFAGYNDNKNNFHYNGTSFVTSASTASIHSAGGGGAPQAAGVIFTGGPSNTTATEEFTGETSALNIKTITTS